MPEAFWKENLKGISCPWKVGAIEDEGLYRDNDYVLKYFRRGDQIPRLIEYLGGRLAFEMDIGAPAVELLHLSPAYLDHLVSSGTEASMPTFAEPGPHVAIKFVDSAGPLSRRSDALDDLKRREQVADIVGFDTMAQNPDRHGNNILVVPASYRGRARHQLVPIDHGGCFHGHVTRAGLTGVCEIAEILVRAPLNAWLRSSGDFHAIVEKLGQWSGATAKVHALVAWVPPEWAVPTEWLVALESHILRRIDVAITALQNEVPRGVPDFQLELGQG